MAARPSQSETPRIPPSESGALSFGTCGNCGAEMNGPFCSQCGEKKLSHHDYSVAHLLEEGLEGLTHFDTRFIRTLKLLLTKPGELSNAYFHGGRSRYTKPLSLFIIINVIFFFIQPHTELFGYKYQQYVVIPRYATAVHEHLLETRESESVYEGRFNENLQHQKKSILLFAVPVLALVMLVVFAGTGRTYAEHLVFSIQVYAFFLAYLTTMALLVLFPLTLGLTWLFPDHVRQISRLGSEFAIDSMILVGLLFYFYSGLRRAYQASRLRSAISGALLSAAVVATIVAYHTVLFYLTFWTT